jgi:hypothetical protein
MVRQVFGAGRKVKGVGVLTMPTLNDGYCDAFAIKVVGRQKQLRLSLRVFN